MKDSVLWARQYSKRLLAFLFTVYTIGGLIGAVYEFLRLVLSPETASMEYFYLYLAVPFTCSIPSYLIPNMSLNKEKVRQGYDPAYDQKYLEGIGIDGDGIGEAAEEELNQNEENKLYTEVT